MAEARFFLDMDYKASILWKSASESNKNLFLDLLMQAAQNITSKLYIERKGGGI